MAPGGWQIRTVLRLQKADHDHLPIGGGHPARLAQPRLSGSTVSGVSTPGAVRHMSPFAAALSALGFEQTPARAPDAPDAQAVLETFRSSETFRWLRRWAVVAVIAIVAPLTVVDAWANEMPDFHHVAVPLAV